MQLYRLAYNQGDVAATYNLADCLKHGRGVEQDYKEAVRLYRVAAAQGNVCAQNNLGDCYDKGHGVPQDHKQAVALYRQAAQQGSSAAQFNLADCFQNGHGVEKGQSYYFIVISRSSILFCSHLMCFYRSITLFF